MNPDNELLVGELCVPLSFWGGGVIYWEERGGYRSIPGDPPLFEMKVKIK